MNLSSFSEPLIVAPAALRCLVVDDDPQVLEATALLVETILDCETVRFDCSVAAWREFERAPESYPVVVSDFNMPELDGLRLARNIWNLRPQTEVILCTGNVEGLAGVDLRAHGIRAVLAKPFVYEQFHSVLKRPSALITPAVIGGGKAAKQVGIANGLAAAA